MSWKALALCALAGCVGGGTTTKDTDTGTVPGTDTATTPITTSPTPPDTGGSTAQCVFPLDEWCLPAYSSGPTGTGTCPTPTLEGALGYTSYFGVVHLRCDDPTHGTLDQVLLPDGYGGPVYDFDSTGAFVAYSFSTDYPLCDGGDGALHYGFVPECSSTCVVDDPSGFFGSYPPC